MSILGPRSITSKLRFEQICTFLFFRNSQFEIPTKCQSKFLTTWAGICPDKSVAQQKIYGYIFSSCKIRRVIQNDAISSRIAWPVRRLDQHRLEKKRKGRFIALYSLLLRHENLHHSPKIHESGQIGQKPIQY